MDRGFKIERTSRDELQYFKDRYLYQSYRELIEAELPLDAQIEQEEFVSDRQEYKRLIHKKYSSPNTEKRISILEVRLVQAILRTRQALYRALLESLESPAVDVARTQSLVKQLRTHLVSQDMFKDKRRELFDSQQSLELLEQRIKSIKPPDDQTIIRMAEFPTVPSYHVDKLYHWAPASFKQAILAQGLLPGFCLGLGSRSFVYASLERNDFWASAKDSDTAPLVYDRGSEKHSEFVEFEIDYGPDLEAYMWVPFYSYSTSDHSLYRSTLYLEALLSSNVVLLDCQVSELLDYDKGIVDSGLKAGRKEKDAASGDPWVYSKLLKQEAPTYCHSWPGAWESSEVLLNYVPPARLRIIG